MNPTHIPPSRGNILVVDDTPANLRLLMEILKKQGYEVRPAPNGKLALSAARGLPPDLILLDINMPEMDGYEVCEKLKADDGTCEIPVIFISALSDVLDKVKAFGVGGIDYITKPFQVEEVLARVETHLTLRSLQTNLQDKNAELAQTLHQLQTTQAELIKSEKMALLGRLVAGIAHEINTPLGAITASVDTIDLFLKENLDQLPDFFYHLSLESQPDFLRLIHQSNFPDTMLSSKERRQVKRTLKRQLEEKGLEDCDRLASIFVNIGIYKDLETWMPLLNAPESEKILKMAYQFAALQRSTRTIETASERAAKVVYALKSYIHTLNSDSPNNIGKEKRKTNPIDGIEMVLTLYQNQLRQGVDVNRKYETLPLIDCYPDELNQVWTNLINNALQAMENKGTLTIEAERKQQQILIKITDTGPGIPEEIKTKIFEPFFTTKPLGEGSGLGLDIISKIIKNHQGEIEVDSNPGKTTFSVLLPIESRD